MWLAVVALLSASPCRAWGADVPADDDEHSPAAERATFTVAEGFNVELFASEADGVVKPIQIRFDVHGRLWVIGSSVYPQIEAGEEPADKVLILEDMNGDGRCDRTTVFADGLTIPTGIELGDGGAYVGHGTQLLHLKDSDGDDRADERRVVLGGFGTGDTHQNINSFAWGPGGELWMSQGLSIRSRVETPWGIVALNKAGLWRLSPRRLKLEGFLGSEREPQNPWGFVFTEWGEPLMVAGNNSSPVYPVPALVPNREDTQLPLIWRNGDGRKCSGGAIVGTAHWPLSWQGTLILGGYINNAVWAVKVVEDGAGFALEDRAQGPLIRSSSQSFRPVDVRFGPDGALYVCDWYNPIIGHYQASFWDKRRDKTRGRIWRVTAKGKPLQTPPRLTGVLEWELLDEMGSKDLWTRHFASRALADLPTERVTPTLARWAAVAGRSERQLVAALGVYQSHEVVEPELLGRLLRAKDPRARAYAAGVVGAWADRLPDPLALLRPLMSDENPRVRLKALVSCTYVPKPEAIEVAMVAADHPTDAFIDYAINQAVASLKPHWVEAFKAGSLRFENKSHRIAALVKADGTADTLTALRAIARQPDLDAPAGEGFLRILADVGDSDDLATIINLDDLPLKGRLLPAVAQARALRGATPTGDPVKIVEGLLAAPNESVRAGALRLVAAWKLGELRPEIERIAGDGAQPVATRVAAAEALPELGGAARATLTRLGGDAATEPAVRAAAIGGLASVDLPAGAAAAAEFLAGGAPDGAVEALVRALLRREGAAAALTHAMGAKPPAADAAKIVLRVMSATGEHHEGLAAALQGAAGLNREPRAFSEPEIAALANEALASGDAGRGAEVFRRAEMSCATCHAVGGEGGRIGPDLGNLGTAQTAEFIIGAVLMPGREVKEGYVAHEVLTRGGERYQGYIVWEDAKELVIRDVATDKELRLPKDAIAKSAQRGSAMPAGLTDTLTRAELRDLIAYLASLGRAAAGAAPP